MNVKLLICCLFLFAFACQKNTPSDSEIAVEVPKCTRTQLDQEVIELRIEANGDVYLLDDLTTLEKIGNCAKESKAIPQISATIVAEAEVPHGKVVEILDLLKSKGIEKVSIQSTETQDNNQ